MKKRLLTAFLILTLIFAAAGCMPGEAASAVLDDKAPWNMPTLYERSEFSVNRYKMKEENKTVVKDKLLASGSLIFGLEEAGNSAAGIPCARLSMNFSFTYNDSEENGADRGLTDTITSEVVFQKVSLVPVSSRRVVDLAVRKDDNGNPVKNDSCEVNADYAALTSTFAWTKRSADESAPASWGMSVSGQVFDNEQLFFAMRAFTNLKASSSQVFKLYHAFDSFVSGPKSVTYNMSMSVAAETVDKYLEGYKGDNNYGFGSETDSVPTVECFNVTLSKSDSHPGPALTAYYSAKPFKISQNIETYKVLCGMETNEFDVSGASYRTYYSLVDYAAVNKPA